VVVTGIFLLLSTVNLILDGYLNQLKTEQNNLVQHLAPLMGEETYLKKVALRIEAYKNAQNNRRLLLPKVTFVLSKIGSDLQIQRFTLNASSFNLLFKSPGAYNVTKLISSYLQDKTVSEIHLKTASLDSISGVFVIEMEGVFK
jgi:hypothetical protein